MQIISWNVNGVRAIARKGFAEWLDQCGADIVCLQETKARVEQVPAELRDRAGYQSDWCSAERGGYSGVATFSRRPPLRIRRGLDDPRFDSEGRVLISEYAEFTLYNIYFPSGNRGPERVAYKLAFYERFLEVVRAEMASGRKLIVVGDVNTAFAPIDLARPRENSRTSGFLPAERAALGRFWEAGLVDSFRVLHPDRVAYSWWSMRTGGQTRINNVGWRLDYIMISANLVGNLQSAEIFSEIVGSDHCPVGITLTLDAANNNPSA